MKVEFTGTINFDYSEDWTTIKLVQPDGYKLDLVSRFREVSESYIGKSFQVNYYLSNTPCTKVEMVEGWLKKISGAIEADYETNSYNYSSWTHGTDYDTVLKIGNHNLFSELSDSEGKFIIIEVNIK